jgi:hypothetical protein
MNSMDRRRFIVWFSTGGLTALLAPEVLAQGGLRATQSAISRAEELLGLDLTLAERKLMAKSVQGHLANYRKLREIPIPNPIPPALTFSPILPGCSVETKEGPFRATTITGATRPAGDAELAFLPLVRLGALREKALQRTHPVIRPHEATTPFSGARSS